MDYLESLKVFRCVVEARSFSRAADMLGLTPPVVSRAIGSLEQRLSSRLFHRTTRQVSLTEAAERFYEGCSRILDDLELLEEHALAQAREPSGVLRLVAHTTATVNRLVPLISAFKRRYSKVSLDVTLTERPVDLVADGYDLGIVLPYMLTSDTTVTRLLDRIPLVVVSSPQYLASTTPPTVPQDLLEHSFVTMSPSIRKPSLSFVVGDEQLNIPMKFDMSSNNAEFNRELVLEGFGIGVVPAAVVEAELTSGRLIRLLEDFQLVEGAIEIRLAYNTRALMPAKVKAFIDHVASSYGNGGTPKPG
ncbi:DNA-binding transcriptional LysR family regulator [Paraburkholderia sp. GAS199]|uniref:LysR family transcriptional regulator n=1 Tax=Paraburkholderia sp. GAS199 TaxID=3035126 RepID=UPI003D1BF917